MKSIGTPPPPTRSPMVDSSGYVSDQWSAFFDRLYSNLLNIPVGGILEYSGADIPVGWLLCDGSLISRTKYEDLFNVVNTRYGAGDGTTFAVPDRRGKFAQGAVTSSDLGTTGGNADYTLVLANLPVVDITITDPGHTHIFDGAPHTHTITDPGHTHPILTAVTGTGGAVAGGVTTTGSATGNALTGITVNPATATGTNETAETGITAQLVGGDQSFSLLPPFINVNYIIKY